MSQLRRERQAKRLAPSLMQRILLIIRKGWKQIFSVLGVSGLVDLIREYARAKMMDSIYEQLGGFGQWLLSYKLALFTLGLIGVLVVIGFAAFQESRKSYDSLILDAAGNPYTIQRIAPIWSFGLAAIAMSCIALVSYGAYTFYRSQNFLEKYPLGYIIFDVDNRNSVFPYQTEKLLDRWEFDWTATKMAEHDPDNFAVLLPNIRYKGSNHPLIEDVGITLPKKVGPFDSYLFTDDVITMKLEILAIRRNGVVFLIGFDRAATPK
jgi:hypothetical protein